MEDVTSFGGGRYGLLRLVVLAEVMPRAVGAVVMQALVAYAPVGIAEEGTVGITVAAVEVGPGAVHDVLGAPLSRTRLIFNAMTMQEVFEIEGCEVAGTQWHHHTAQQLFQHPRARHQGGGGD